MNADLVKTVIQGAIEYDKLYRQKLRQDFEGAAFGTRPVNGPQFLEFIQMMNEKYPPQQFILPDGSTIFASPWMLMLQFVDGGAAELQRYDRLMGLRMWNNATGKEVQLGQTMPGKPPFQPPPPPSPVQQALAG